MNNFLKAIIGWTCDEVLPAVANIYVAVAWKDDYAHIHIIQIEEQYYYVDYKNQSLNKLNNFTKRDTIMLDMHSLYSIMLHLSGYWNLDLLDYCNCVKKYENADIILEKILYNHLPFDVIKYISEFLKFEYYQIEINNTAIFTAYCSHMLHLYHKEDIILFHYNSASYAIRLGFYSKKIYDNTIRLHNCRTRDGTFVILSEKI